MKLSLMHLALFLAIVPHMPQHVMAGDDSVPIVFMEPADAGRKGGSPIYQLVQDAERIASLRRWMDNSAGECALRMYQGAWRTVQESGKAAGKVPAYYIALVPGGNHADAGFRLETGEGLEEHPHEHYIKLAPEARAFDITFAHETGHVVLGILSQGKGVPEGKIVSIPHTTSALTDRATALNEGFAIYIETLLAHTATDRAMRAFYHHERFLFGDSHQKTSEYHRAGMDLRSYSQTLARYHEVRENTYAFASAFEHADYLRIQLDKVRNYARLRDANQLLQSEGFYATFFFGLTMRGDGVPQEATIAERQDRIFEALAGMLSSDNIDRNTPFLLEFVVEYMRRYPSESPMIVDVLLDLSHGAFVDAQAADLWREYYMGGIKLDIKGPIIKAIENARSQWRSAVLRDPTLLFGRIGPQIPCTAEGASVRLEFFGRDMPLVFDVNTVQPGIIRLIPGITEEKVSQWIEERANAPFQNVEDFTSRVSLDPALQAKLQFRPG